MAETCKREVCTGKPEYRARYEGYCSLECRDYDEYEQEIKRKDDLLRACDICLIGYLQRIGTGKSGAAIRNSINALRERINEELK